VLEENGVSVSRGVDFRILGPLEVLDDGRALELGGAKQRAVLGVLLLNANRVVARDQLVDAIWGERAPETATKALQVYVSQLRKTLGRDRILTRTPGYQLRVEPGELDVERFDTFVSTGSHDEALALWRGRALADFAYEPFFQPELARLEEARLSCLEERAEAGLAAGRHLALVGNLEALVSEQPLRERLRAQLMVALYRSGRQAEALDVYQEGRALLGDELGLEPSAELKELQRAILAQDPSLELRADGRRAGNEEGPEAKPGAPPTRSREVRKTVTVLSCHVIAAGRDLDPESLRHLTSRGLDEVVPVLERHGATVERSIGGAISAIFGIPAVHEDDALRAVRAAVAVRDRLADLKPELEVAWNAWLELRIGIGTGEVLASADADRSFATGQPVQSAIDLQQAAQPGELLVDSETYRVVRDSVEALTAGDHARLTAVLALERGEARFDSPMVGRERERRRLRDAFEQALGSRSCQLFTVLGAAGVGKSRLVQEFVADLAGTALVARGRCLPYGEGITYWPVLEAVRDAASLDDASSSEDNLTRLASVLEGEDDSDGVARRLGEVVGLVDQTSSVEETFRAVCTFVEVLARARPLVLVFDDIHWGEATFLDLVDRVSDWVRAPVLVTCMARPELLEIRPNWGGGKLNATSVLLEPLSDDESETLLDNLAGSAAIDEAARHRIVETAGGNPLFVEEMLALLLEDSRDGATLEVPATIQALLAARLDRLPDAERSAIEAASVEGKVFHEASVAALSGMQSGETHDALLALTRRDLIRNDRPVFSGERAYRFRHLLIRDAAYDSVPKETRAFLHERHATWLETVGQHALELDEIVGYHFEQAFEYRAGLGPVDDHARAVGRAGAERLGTAGRRAFMRSDGPAGVNLISRSVALLPPDDPFRVELVPNVRVIQGLSDLSWADRVLTEAVEAAATSGDRGLAAHALVQRGFLRLFFAGSSVTPGELFDVADRAIEVFDELGDQLGLARAWRLVAQAHYLDRRALACAEASEQALVFARGARDRFEEREIVEWLVIAHLLGPTPVDEAFRRCTVLLEQEWDDFWLPAEIWSAAAALAAMQGRSDEAEELVERGRRAMHEAQEYMWLATFWQSFVRFLHGDPAAAEAELRPAYEALKRIGETSHFSSIAHALSNAMYLQGGYDQAERLTEECERAARQNDIHSQILWRSTRAKVFARRGEHAEATRLAREALGIAEGSDFLLAHADACADLSEVLELAGRRGEAVRALEEAIDLHVQKGNVPAADVCRARLVGLRDTD
jgi:DNA-binding SARP family transcriptional activator/tetratricopeptide (TPR) repeat protein